MKNENEMHSSNEHKIQDTVKTFSCRKSRFELRIIWLYAVCHSEYYNTKMVFLYAAIWMRSVENFVNWVLVETMVCVFVYVQERLTQWEYIYLFNFGVCFDKKTLVVLQ